MVVFPLQIQKRHLQEELRNPKKLNSHYFTGELVSLPPSPK